MTFRAVVRPLKGCVRTPTEIFEALRPLGWRSLLQSGRDGRYSYLFGPPVETVSIGPDLPSYHDASAEHMLDPWRKLEALVNHHVLPNPHLRNFCGGAVGYLAYDLGRTLERLPASTVDDLGVPGGRFERSDRFIEFDHLRNDIRIVVLVDQRAADPTALLEAIEGALRHGVVRAHGRLDAPVQPPPEWNANLSRKAFEEAVQRVKNYIFEGDAFQVNLSVRFDTTFSTDPFDIYCGLLSINPSPFMAYLEYDDLSIASASPELLVRISHGRIETRPIAGTRPRGRTPEDDLTMAAELVDDEKEQAEHLMLVDLERNDIGRVARFGSVHVDQFMGIERYSHVVHIVSHVSAELAADRSMMDGVKAMFPGGTITGAPKVRAMEIIDELEPTRRGIYTGSIGWIGFGGACELNIAIRSVLVHGGRAFVQAGAGIVADSIPRREYDESKRKAAAGMEAVAQARRAVAHDTVRPV